jgi:putative tryptophan/tyrosine transport system substrate-binding protein
MRRREFITLTGGAAAAAWPLAARAQTLRQRPLVGLLQVQSLTGSARYTSEFLRGMSELGYIEGRDIDFERRYADGDLKRLPALANELVKLKPDVILTSTSAAALAFTQVTQSIPIVATALVDPVGFGLAASEARPGGQVTGILISLDPLPGKQLALALEVVPGAAKVGVLLNALNPTTAVYRAGIEAAAATLSIKLVSVEVRGSDDLDAAFQEFVREKVELVFVAQDSLLLTERARLATLATAARLPTMYGLREHVEAGGLICYGINVAENFRRAARFVDKILKGAKAGNLPIELPVRLELLVNLKTAKSIGLVISESFLVRADEVIE